MEEAEKAKVTGDRRGEKELGQTEGPARGGNSPISKKKTQTIEAQLGELEAERATLASEGIEEDLLNQYERLFASKGDLRWCRSSTRSAWAAI